MSAPPPLSVSRCESCHNRFIPRAGPCPRCGGSDVSSVVIEPQGTVLAATQLESPPAGWSVPHRLALIELEESVRILAIVDRPLPELGTRVLVRLVGDQFRVT